MNRTILRDDQWERIKDLLPGADSTHKCNSTFRNRGQAAVASLSFVPARMRGTDDYLHTAYPRATIPD